MDRGVEELLRGSDREQDCRALIAMMERVTGEPARLMGPSIVGFGTYHYRYASGHEGDTCLTRVRAAEVGAHALPPCRASSRR